jgi:hypothetical protein
MRLGFALVLVAALTSPAWAEDDSVEKAQARLLLSQGNAYFEKGDLRAALVNFRAAYSAYPSPKLLVNAAFAERELGDLAGAATDLRHFIDDASDDDQALVERARADLKALEKRVARIGIPAWSAHSTLEIDGRSARDPTFVKPGSHSVHAQSPAGAELSKDLDVSAGDVVELPMPPPPLRSSGRVLPLLPSAGVSEGPAHHSSRRTGVIVGVVVGAVVLVGVGLGVGLYYYVQNNVTMQPLTGPLGTFRFSDFN